MARRARRYWLMKSEPSVYSITDLEREGTTMWEGVRNYQARNSMRDDMAPGRLWCCSITRTPSRWAIAR